MDSIEEVMRKLFGPGLVGPGQGLSDSDIKRVSEVIDGNNVVQIVLHAHMLIERTITARISNKLVRPDLLDAARLSFSQKIVLFRAMHNVPEDVETKLIQFNRLRNRIAHGLGDENQAVFEYFPWTDERPPDAAVQARLHGTVLLLLLGGIAIRTAPDGPWVTVTPSSMATEDEAST